MAISTQVAAAHQIWLLKVFSLVARERLMRPPRRWTWDTTRSALPRSAFVFVQMLRGSDILRGSLEEPA